MNERKKKLLGEDAPPPEPQPLTPGIRMNIMRGLARDPQLLELGASKKQWWAAAALIQLALRHPQMSQMPDAAAMGRQLADNIFAAIAASRPAEDRPHLVALAEEGYHPPAPPPGGPHGGSN